jgi:hypothetical protein
MIFATPVLSAQPELMIFATPVLAELRLQLGSL